MDLSLAEADAQRIEQRAQLGPIDLAVAIAVHSFEAVSQRIAAHCRKIRRFAALSNGVTVAVWALSGCRGAPQVEPAARASASGVAAPTAGPEPVRPEHPAAPASTATPSALPPLSGAWLVSLETPEVTAFVTPPIGATAPRPLVVGVHGAGDRPEWSCGGWRLASQSNAFVVCPQGNKMTPQTFAWASPQVLAARVDAAVAAARAKFAPYVDSGSMIFAGFSQGATFAEPFLRQNAARFPIAILAEGGYATARSASFAKAFRAAGGRRIVLVCGSAQCFTVAVSAKQVLETAGVEALVVGDAKAGHNLNERMQKALQAAWPEISAPPRELSHQH
jgi:predicted esterase